jgi:hypothetical protein
MQHRAATAAVSALALTLILATSALAGGWAQAIMDSPPDEPGGANQPVTIGFTLLQHGVTPVDWGTAKVVLTNDATGQSIIADARPQGAVGHWVAEIGVPATGTWTYAIRHDLEIEMTGFAPLVVGPSVAQPASATAAATGTGIQPALLLAAGFLSLLTLAGVTVGIIAARRGRLDRVQVQ